MEIQLCSQFAELYVIELLQVLGFTSSVRDGRTSDKIARGGSSRLYFPSEGKSLH